MENVWAGHPVGFCLLTHGDHQFVAYFNTNREMTVASRKLGETKWTIQRLFTKLGWDSQAYVTMALDGAKQHKNIYMLGDIVHNEHVIEKTKEAGIKIAT